MPFTKRGFLKFSEIIILVAIFTAGLFLYFYKLDGIPNGLYVDEASQGYNAYSIILTGRDEYGKSFPILFRFLAVYTPPIYTYLTTLPVTLFGLSIFSVRVISALSAVLSLFVVYLFLKFSEVLKKKISAILGSLLFLISPWLLLHGRYGHEVTTAFLIFSVGSLLLFLALKRTKLVIYGFIILSLSTYSSYTERYLVPLFIIGYLFLFRKKLLNSQNIKDVITGLILAVIIQIPHFTIFATPAFLVKSDLFYYDEILSQADKIAKFLPHGVAIVLSFFREFLAKYLTYFSPKSLFFCPTQTLKDRCPSYLYFIFGWLYHIWLGFIY